MTTYSTISNASLAVGAIPSSTVVTALRDNPIAMAEAASGAPINAAGWHPVDKVTVGDGKNGKIYDSSTSGTVASVITADFADGWEYLLFGTDLSHNSGTSQSMNLDLYHETDAAYVTYAATGSASGTLSGSFVSFQAQLIFPRVSKRVHMLNWQYSNAAVTVTESAYKFQSTSVAQKILRARIIYSAGSIDNGTIWLFRRREFASSP